MKKSDKMRELMAGMAKGAKPKKAKKEEASSHLDANKDGKVDEKDAAAFEEASKAVKKRIKKKKQD